MKYLLIILLLIPSVLQAQFPCLFNPCCFHGWETVDYMYLWRKNRSYPPLVTTSPVGTPFADAGVLGLPTTSILFGGKVHNHPKLGVRADLGVWLAPILGIGGGFFAASTIDKRYLFTSNDYPILARPFFSVTTGATSTVVTFPTGPNETIGFVRVDTLNRIWGADLYGRYRICQGAVFKPDLLLGVMYVRLDDQVTISTSQASLPPDETLPTNVNDKFVAENRFLGGLVGLSCDLSSLNWGLQGYVKAGIGSMSNSIGISGFITSFDSMGNLSVFNSGILTQGTNIGDHTANYFEIMTQIGAKLKFRIWRGVWATLGYNLVHWPKVALAAEQIDLTINESQVFDMPLVGEPRPAFNLKTTNFWLQGITAGCQIIF